MKYQETIDFLYKQIPAFERQGASGYKPGLGTAIALDDWLGNPHRAYKCIHVAGTNGKGSVSNLLAATLQESGYRVGLFTSPHLADFRERIRVNGEMIDKRSVSRFVERYFKSGLTCEPSFFELTTAMAFEYFKQQKVDYAVIEVGLGGRLDSSNIITPILSVITNISIDHTQFLGNTLAQIASEKAGIIKPGVPVVVGEASQEEVRDVFERSASECHSPITYASDEPIVVDAVKNTDGTQTLITSTSNSYLCQLGGDYQRKNVNTVFHCINLLKKMGLNIKATAIKKALKQVSQLTGFVGRWTVAGKDPIVGNSVAATGWTEMRQAAHGAGLLGRQRHRHRLGNDAQRCHLLLHSSPVGTLDESTRLPGTWRQAWIKRRMLHKGNRCLQGCTESRQSQRRHLRGRQLLCPGRLVQAHCSPHQ